LHCAPWSPMITASAIAPHNPVFNISILPLIAWVHQPVTRMLRLALTAAGAVDVARGVAAVVFG
jgi:hypothetical protein